MKKILFLFLLCASCLNAALSPALLAAAHRRNATSFTPASLPNPLFWIEADTSVYSDAGVTPATNGGSVAQVNDLSGNGFNFTSSGAAKPVYVTGVLNSKPVLRFGSVTASYMDSSASNAGGSYSIGVVVNTANYANNYVLQGGQATSGQSLDTNSSKFRTLKQGVALIGQSTTSLTNSTWYVVIVTYDGATGNYAFYVNGAADGTGTNSQTFSATNTRIGTDETGISAVLTGDIAAMWKGTSALTSTQALNLSAYWRTKWAAY